MKLTLIALVLMTAALLTGCNKFTTGDAHRTMSSSQVTHGMTGDQHWNHLNYVTITNLRSLREDWFRMWLYDHPSRTTTYPIQ